MGVADENMQAPRPFAAFEQEVVSQSALRAAITAAYRVPEPECVPALIVQARLAAPVADAAQSLARRLVVALRASGSRGGVEALIQEFSLSSQEGVALMCLAEALLRIPDTATRDALIRDKIGGGDWSAHASNAPSLFVNAATWGLMITGKLVATSSEASMASALTRLIAKGGEPLIRKGVDLGMRLMGEQFVSGETIEQALANGRKREAKGFRHSYDMLGEAAITAEDAQRYYSAYEHAIHAIGNASARRGIYDGPGISIKLSALHPRYSRAQRTRVLVELLQLLAGDDDGAGVRPLQSGHHHQQRRFAGAGRAEEANRLATAYIEVDLSQDMDAGGAAAERQVDARKRDGVGRMAGNVVHVRGWSAPLVIASCPIIWVAECAHPNRRCGGL